MSWKQYGGTNKLDKMNNINVSTLSTDSFRLHGPYQGDFDICGNLHLDSSMTIFGSLNVKNDVFIERNTIIDKDLVINGNAFSNNNLVITDGSFNGNVNVRFDTNMSGNLRVRSNARIFDTLYFDPNSTEFFHGENNKLGLNVYNPTATLDICGNIRTVLNVYSNQEETRNVLVRNKNNRGIALNSNTNASYIDFFVDSSLNSGNIYDGRIIQTPGGVMTFDVSYNSRFFSNMSISNRTQSDHIYNETLIVYDNSYGVLHGNTYKVPSAISGNAVAFIANDNSSNTFMKIITPNNTGLHVNGGAYPLDQTRSMGSFNWIDNSGLVIPAQMIVSGNNYAKYRSTIGFNTLAPRTEKYVIDINGPLHITNGQIKHVVTSGFEIKSVSRYRNYQNNVIAVGTPSSLSSNFTQNIYYSTDTGQSWNLSAVDRISDFEKNVGKKLTSVYTYDNSYSVMCGDLGYMYYTINGGKLWSQFGIGSTNSNFTALFVDSSNIYFSNDLSLNYFNNPYTNPAIPASGTPILITNPSVTYTINTSTGYTVSSINQKIAIKSIHGISNKLFISGNGIARYDKTIATSQQLLGNPPGAVDNSYNVGGQYIYNSIHSVDINNVVSVGANIISYSKTGGTSWTDISIPNTFLNSVYVYDTSNAIAVGNSGTILYSKDSYATWSSLPTEVLISSGNSILLNDTSDNYTNITMSDANTFVISATNTIYISGSQLGKSKLLYFFAPNLFNLVNSTVIDVCGNMHLTGDIQLDNSAFINNSAFIKGNVESYGQTTGTVVITGGVGITANTNIGGNVTVQNALYNSFIECSDLVSGNINIGTLPKQSRYINIGDINSNTGFTNIINMGGRNDILSIKSTVQLGDAGSASGSTVINGNLRVLTPTGLVNAISSVGGIIIESTSTNSGLLLVTGGVGISANTYVGGNININRNLIVNGGVESVSSTTGTIIVTGGIGVSANTYVGGNININKNLIVNGNVESVSSTTGTVIIKGGLGVSENIYIGGNTNVIGLLKLPNTTQSIGTSTGALIVTGGVGVKSNIFVGGNITILSNIEATDMSSGSLIVKGGGVSIFGNLYTGGNAVIAGNLNITKNTETINSTSGTLVISNGGLAVTRGNVYVGGNIVVINTNDSTSASTGVLLISGGVGISKNLFIGSSIDISNNVTIRNNIEATNTSSGSLLIPNGGVSITKGNLYAGGNVVISRTDESTSSTSGVLIVSGGIGIAANIYVGGNSTISGNLTITKNTETTSLTSGALIISNGGLGVTTGNIYVGGNINIQKTTDSSSTNSGVLLVSGGVGIAKSLFIGNNVDISRNLIVRGGFATGFPQESTSNTTGSLIVSGGVGIYANVFVGGNITITRTVDAVDCSSGVFIVSGGAGIVKNMIVGGNIIIGNNILPKVNSTSTNSGALIVSGGVGIANDLYFGGTMVATGNVQSTSTNTGTVLITGGVGITANVYIGGNVVLSSSNQKLLISSSIEATSFQSGSFITSGGIGVTGNIMTGGNITIQRTNESTDYSSGVLIVSGGVGIAKNLFVGGNITITKNIESTTSTTGTLIISGGIGITGNLNTGANVYSQNIFVKATETPTDTNTGALRVLGGIGIAKDIFIGGSETITGNIKINSTLDTTSTGTGSLIVSGGVGIAKALNIGGNTSISGNLSINPSGTTGLNITTTTVSQVNSVNLVTNAGDAYSSFYTGTNSWAIGIKNADNYFRFNWNASTPNFNSTSTVFITTAGLVNAATFNATSDYRIKENVVPLNSSFNVDKLKPVFYKNKNLDKQDIGFIAHEVQEIYPYLVEGEKDGKEFQSVNYSGLIGVLVNEIQNLKKEVAELKYKVDKIENV